MSCRHRDSIRGFFSQSFNCVWNFINPIRASKLQHIIIHDDLSAFNFAVNLEIGSISYFETITVAAVDYIIRIFYNQSSLNCRSSQLITVIFIRESRPYGFSSIEYFTQRASIFNSFIIVIENCHNSCNIIRIGTYLFSVNRHLYWWSLFFINTYNRITAETVVLSIGTNGYLCCFIYFIANAADSVIGIRNCAWWNNEGIAYFLMYNLRLSNFRCFLQSHKFLNREGVRWNNAYVCSLRQRHDSYLHIVNTVSVQTAEHYRNLIAFI